MIEKQKNDPNPLLQDYEIPPLDKLKPEYFEAALDKALAEGRQALEAIRNDPKPATYENTVLPLEQLYVKISGVLRIFSSYESTHEGKAVDDANVALSNKQSEFDKQCFQDKRLGKRFEEVGRHKEQFTVEDRELYERFLRDFVNEGALLQPDDRIRLLKIDKQLNNLCAKFGSNLKADVKKQAVFFKDSKELDGLPSSTIASFNKAAKKKKMEGYLVVPERLQVDTMLEQAENPDFRRQVLEALDRIGTGWHYNKEHGSVEYDGKHDNEKIIMQIRQLRQERAELLGHGFQDHADFALRETILGSRKAVEDVLDELARPSLKQFEKDFIKVRQFAARNGGPKMKEKFEPSDFPYWLGRYRKDELHYDVNKLSEYLPLNQVIKGYFDTCTELFGVTFDEIKDRDYPRSHPTVKTYKVFDRKHDLIGILHADFYAREGKSGGASALDAQLKIGKHPKVVILKMNLPEPDGNQQPLLSLADAETLFHEGGHAMNQLLGAHTKHPMLQGTYGGNSDFTEIHSMLLENWVHDRKNLSRFAQNLEGEPVPDHILDAMEQAEKFGAESSLLRTIQNAKRDLVVHSAEHQGLKSTKEIEETADYKTEDGSPHPMARYLRSYPLTRFDHLFSDALSKYAAGYSGYVMSWRAEKSAYATLTKLGIGSPEAVDKIATFYGDGTSHPMESYVNLNGGLATSGPILESVGVSCNPYVAAESGRKNQRQ